ncbi:MAG: tRNA (guanosine(46)-N7)-methyltransferase TrmB [Clostridia bacterium]
MRLRKKKHLEERMELVKDILLFVEGIDFYLRPQQEKINLFDFATLFGNTNPTHLEIGCGKGQFVAEMAKLNPNINFVAIEKVSNVIVSACELVKKENLTNVRFLNCCAENLEFYIKPQTLSKIYLNFSCPYPKSTYANHRLTNVKFLQIYKKLMLPQAEIHQKTDNQLLFEYSIEQLSQNGFAFKEVSLDLHKSKFKGNVETEYETNFVKLGKPIFRLEAYLK